MVLDASVCSSSLLAQLYLLGVLLQHVGPRVQHWWLEHRFVRGWHSPLDVGKAVHVGSLVGACSPCWSLVHLVCRDSVGSEAC